jgi:hypothetical protein
MLIQEKEVHPTSAPSTLIQSSPDLDTHWHQCETASCLPGLQMSTGSLLIHLAWMDLRNMGQNNVHSDMSHTWSLFQMDFRKHNTVSGGRSQVMCFG